MVILSLSERHAKRKEYVLVVNASMYHFMLSQFLLARWMVKINFKKNKIKQDNLKFIIIFVKAFMCRGCKEESAIFRSFVSSLNKIWVFMRLVKKIIFCEFKYSSLKVDWIISRFGYCDKVKIMN